MATRKSGDGSRSADVGSERPGSYVKVSGSRRRRKGKRGSTIPPADVVKTSDSLDTSAVVDTVGEETDDGRISDLGDVAVDDLRRPSKPSSNRAPRKEVGPLGLEDIRSDPPANTVDLVDSDPPHRSSSDSPHVNVVEINSAASRSSRRSLFDEDDEEPEDQDDFASDGHSYPSQPERSDEELARDYDLDSGVIGSDIRASLRPARSSLARVEDPYDSQDATHSLSSVLGARPSLRPSPPPEKKRDAASVLWWLVVSGLTAIIAAAVTIAAREQMHQQAEPTVAPVAKVAPAPDSPRLAKPVPPPVSFGTPQTMPKAEPAKPKEPRAAANPSAAAAVVPAANSAAVRTGAAGTSAVSGAAATGRPVNHTGPAASAAKPGTTHKTAAVVVPPKPNIAPEAERPVETERAVGDPNYAPGYGKQINPGTSYAPGYGGKPAARPEAERGKPKLTPARETTATELPGLPVNPYE